MFNRTAGIVLALVMALAVLPVSAHDEMGFTGTLTAVDAGGDHVTLTFKENGKDETVRIAITPKTAITEGEKTVDKSALKVGQRVSASAVGCEGEEYEGMKIRILPAASK